VEGHTHVYKERELQAEGHLWGQVSGRALQLVMWIPKHNHTIAGASDISLLARMIHLPSA
jgi:hypothetical protein